MRRGCSCWAVIVLACLIHPRALAGDDQANRPAVDPKADELLRRMSKQLAAARAFSFQAHVIVDEFLDSGQKIQLSSIRTITIRRPDRAYAEAIGDVDNRRIWYDGRTIAQLDRARNEYSVARVPDTIEKMMDFLYERYGIEIPLADLLVDDPYQSAMRNVLIGRYIGLHHVRTTRCHHLAFRQEAVDWQIWIDAGEIPWPRKLVITFRESPGQPQFMAIFDKWKTSLKLSDRLFQFEAPAGAKKVELKPVSEMRSKSEEGKQTSSP